MATKILIILLILVIVLGILAYFTVFTPGTYQFSASNTAPASGTLSFATLANGSGTSNGNNPNSNASSGPNAFVGASSAQSAYSSTYSYPYVLNWNEGQNDFSVTGAAFDGAALTLLLKVQVGNVGGCLPVDLRLVTNERQRGAPSKPGSVPRHPLLQWHTERHLPKPRRSTT